MEIWRHGDGDMELWRWRHEDIVTCKHGDIDMEAWKYGKMETLGQVHGDMEKWT
jgi:hypothetical protein